MSASSEDRAVHYGRRAPARGLGLRHRPRQLPRVHGRPHPLGGRRAIDRGLGARYRILIHVGSADVGGLIEVVEWNPEGDMAWSSVTGIDQRGPLAPARHLGRRHPGSFRFAYGVAGGGISGLISERVGAPSAAPAASSAPLREREADRWRPEARRSAGAGRRRSAVPAGSPGGRRSPGVRPRRPSASDPGAPRRSASLRARSTFSRTSASARRRASLDALVGLALELHGLLAQAGLGLGAGAGLGLPGDAVGEPADALLGVACGPRAPPPRRAPPSPP